MEKKEVLREAMVVFFKSPVFWLISKSLQVDTVFNVIRMKSKNKFVKKSWRCSHQIMSKFANGTFSWISRLRLWQNQKLKLKPKCWIFFPRTNSGGQLESKGWQVEQKRKAQMLLSSHFSGGFLAWRCCHSTSNVITCLFLPILLHNRAVVVVFSRACHRQYRAKQQSPESKSCWEKAGEKQK